MSEAKEGRRYRWREFSPKGQSAAAQEERNGRTASRSARLPCSSRPPGRRSIRRPARRCCAATGSWSGRVVTTDMFTGDDRAVRPRRGACSWSESDPRPGTWPRGHRARADAPPGPWVAPSRQGV